MPQPRFSSPMRFSAGTRTSVKNTSLKPKLAGHAPDRAHLDAGEVHRDDEVRDAAVLRAVGARARDEDAELGVIGERRPDLLAVHDVDVTVAHRTRREAREVGTRARLAEQLAPHLLAREHRPEVALLLLVVAERDEDRSAVADADRVDRFRDAGAPHLVFDDQLQRGIGVEPVGPRPVRHDEPRVDELRGVGVGVLGEPAPHFDAARVVFGRQVDVHARSLAFVVPAVLN